jgi:hypothetical protein
LAAATDVDTGVSTDAEVNSSDVADSIGQLGPRDAQHLSRLTERELGEFVRELRERLTAAGIDTSTSFELISRGDGEIVVDGHHPQRPDIEEIFSSHPSLADKFQRLVAAATAEARQQDPDEARDREFHLELISGSIPEVRFV